MKHHSAQRDYWRSLEHLANSPEIQEAATKEFSAYDPDELLKMPSVTRRKFMKLASASMAFAGLALTGCRRWPETKLAPYASRPEGFTPGIPQQYATVMELNGVASPLLVTSYDGRPIKIEGNPTHPWSQTIAGKSGAADAIAQSSILEMYDPDRSRAVVHRVNDSQVAGDWNLFTGSMSATIDSLTSAGGDGLAILSESTSSQTTARLKAAVSVKFPKAAFFEYEPISRSNEAAGVQMALGQAGRTILHLDRAMVVALLDADPLGTHPAHVRYAGEWAMNRPRIIRRNEMEMSRVYAIESGMTLSGSIADCRLGVKPSRIGAILSAMAARLGAGGADVTLAAEEEAFVKPLLADIEKNHGRSVVAVGPDHEPALHALALAINDKIGAIGSTITVVEERNAVNHFDSIADLTKRLKAKQVNTLVILGGNPVYDAPADLNFADAMKSAATAIHLSLYDNETSHACAWHLPRAHYLEAWGDYRAWDGTAGICQPLIQPLYDGKTSDQVLAFLAGEPEIDSDAIVRKTFTDLDEGNWRQALNDGLIKDTAYAQIASEVKPATVEAAAQPGGFTVRFQQDASLYDGRFATSGWLQELPDPLSKIVWDNAALISKKDADSLQIERGDTLKITVGGQSIEIAAFILPGQPAGVIGLPLGYGRTLGEHIGSDVGVNTYVLRNSGGMFFAAAEVAKTGNYYELAMTQDHHLLDQGGIEMRQSQVGGKHESAEVIRETTLAEYKKNEKIFEPPEEEPKGVSLQLYQEPMVFSDPHQWGMAIDLSKCIGCHACVAACQAENNIPIVGKDQVLKNRQMHWIRIDRYFKGDADDPNPELVFQPVACQQCENAPCEQVCPVGATVHDSEGLNVMVYNRCVGTRYCSNNCPYKVRRFNYLDWHDQDPRHDKYPKPYLNIPDLQQMDQVPEVKRMMFNPEVTVRMRGVMEKCTFCVQRIHTKTIAERAHGDKLKDGDIMTACQQSCPTQAIVFGDLNDHKSKVSQWHANSRAYGLLDEALQTRPRNKYLAKLSNPVEA